MRSCAHKKKDAARVGQRRSEGGRAPSRDGIAHVEAALALVEEGGSSPVAEQQGQCDASRSETKEDSKKKEDSDDDETDLRVGNSKAEHQTPNTEQHIQY